MGTHLGGGTIIPGHNTREILLSSSLRLKMLRIRKGNQYLVMELTGPPYFFLGSSNSNIYCVGGHVFSAMYARPLKSSFPTPRSDNIEAQTRDKIYPRSVRGRNQAQNHHPDRLHVAGTPNSGPPRLPSQSG